MSDKEVEVGVEAITSTDVDTIPPPTQEDDTDDGSSIEVLNWSDFSEDEMEAAKLAAAREFPPDGTNNVAAAVVVPEESESSIMVESQESTDSVATVQDKIEDAMSGLSSKSSSQDEDEEFQNLEYLVDVVGEDPEDDDDTEKDADTEKIQDEDVFGSMLSINSNISKEGSSSNLPVLDDGPIWGKGEKLYRFHENRTINQKLTFGVLISVVLAVGIGLGNLVAYQEYEGEQHHHHHENSKIEQHFHHCPASRVPLTENTNDHHVPVVSNGFPSSIRISTDQASPSDDLIKQRTSTQDRYTIQNDALAYVVKSLDELSKKLEHFENTTRQLSGIIVMSDEARSASSHNPGRKSAENTEESSDDLSRWDVPSDRPLTFSQVVHSDQETPEQVEPTAQLPVFHVPDHLNVLSTDEEPSEATQASMQEPIKPKSRHSKSQKKRREADNFAPEHVHQVQQRKSKKDKHSHKLDRHQPEPLIPSSPQEQKMERPVKIEEIKRKRRPVPREELKRERSPPEEAFRRQRSATQEGLKRDWSPPREYKRERSPPSSGGQRERSPPRDDLRREGSPSRKQNKKRENPPPHHDWNRPIPHPARQHQRGKNGMENYPPHVIYLPENNYSNFDVKESQKRWKKNEYENSFDFEPSKSKRKHKYDDRVVIDNPQNSRGNEFPPGPFPDWDLERAKLRESQRIQSNWDKDFRASQRKRQQNWQIERDRAREKVRSKGL